MKKVLAIFLALIIGLTMTAQIQNKILGFTLGETTKAEVYNKYKNELDFSMAKNGDCSFNVIDFGGYTWDNVRFEFYKGKLYYVSFFIGRLAISDNFKMWNKLKSSLDRKYSQYYLNSSTKDIIQYSDKHTSITLKHYDNRGYYGFGTFLTYLIYTDLSISRQKRIDEENEL